MSNYSPVNYGDIGARINLYAVATFLRHAEPFAVLEKFGKFEEVPKNKSMNIVWRRSIPFQAAVDKLVEGVTPTPQGLEYENVVGQLAQYGSWIPFTDVLIETHEDNNLKEMTILASEQAVLTKEKILWATLTGGTNVVYSGVATTRATVVAPFDLNDFRLAQLTLKNAIAKPITKILAASERIATQPVAPGYVAFGHTNLEPDLRNITGFVPRENYSNSSALLHELEIGKLEDLRFILSPHFTPLLGAGGATTAVRNTGGVADVYQIVILAQDAFAVTPLRGMSAAKVAVKNPVMGESYEDPLGQRGFVAWKMWYAAARLNEAWLIRMEGAVNLL